MKKILTFIIALVFIVSVPLGLVACDNQDDGLIRLNEVTHSIFYAPQYLAIALGYFNEAGLTVELTNGAGADNTMTALLTNEADIGLMGPESSIYVYLEGRKNHPKVFGQLTKRDGSFLVSRNNEPNFDWTNLAGKQILMGRRGGMPAMILQYILNTKGYYDGKNITMNYEIQFGLLGAAFTGGTGDYVPLFEPVASNMESQGKGHIVTGIGLASGEIPYTCYVATSSYIEKNPEKLEKFLSCIYKATKYLTATDNNKLADLLLPYFAGTEKSLIVSALANYKAYDTWMSSPVMQPASWERLLNILENAGELDRRVDFSTLVDNSIANKVSQ
ncbi:MAG: ABC transporter substrate-binding protein [Clostridia bacterium]